MYRQGRCDLMGVGQRAEKGLINHKMESGQSNMTSVTSKEGRQPRKVAELLATKLALGFFFHSPRTLLFLPCVGKLSVPH